MTKRIAKNKPWNGMAFLTKTVCATLKKSMMQKRVYMRKNCIFVPILKWSTCENSLEGGNASEGAYCKMVNIVTDKLFLQ